MNKDEIIAIIQKELKGNPQATDIEIAKKYEIPLRIVLVFKKIQMNAQRKHEALLTEDKE